MRQVAIIAAVFVASFVMFSRGASAQAEEAQTKPKPVIVEVKSGDSLSEIAKRKKTTWTRIFNANQKIKDPDMIYPGDKLRIPGKKEKLKNRVAPTQQNSIEHNSRSAYTPSSSNYKSRPMAATGPTVGGSVWDRLAACESGGNWAINTGNGYYGGLQFTLSTWRGVGGQGYPHQASKAEQIKRGQILQARSGWGQWPACTAKLGLR